MKPRKKIVTTIMVIFTISIIATSQEKAQDKNLPANDTILNEIKGIVVDSKTNKPLPYSHISIKNKPFGTITNEDGFFVFKYTEENKNDTLIISYIGYENYVPKLSIFHDSMNLIELQPAPIIIDKVVVHEKTALSIIKEAIQKIPENYNTNAHIMSGFYRETISENHKYIKYAEGVIDIYREKGNDDLIKLIKGRKKEDNQYESGKKTVINIGGPGGCLYRDLSKYSREFLNKKYFNHYDYKIKSITNYMGKSVYVISFDRKEGNKKARYKGELFIDKNSLALIKANYCFNDWGLKDRQPGFMTRTMLKAAKMEVKLYNTEVSVNYENVDGQWYLKNIRYNDTIFVIKKKKEFLYKTQKDLMISSLLRNNVAKFPKKEILSGHKEFRKQVGKYDKEFWKNNNIIEITNSQKIQIDNIEGENK